MTGASSEAWGRSAEAQAAAWYEARGGEVLDRRVRSEGGELDLVVSQNGCLVFVEVKARRSIADALAAVTPRKSRRLMAAAAGYAAERGTGDVDMRFDIAAIDRAGRLEVVENALICEGWA